MKNRNLQKTKVALFVLLLTLIGTTNVFAQEFTVGKLKYKVIDEGKSVTLLGHIDGPKAKGDLVVPETVTYKNTTYPVTSIGFKAFEDCKGLTSVTIGNSVTSIGYYAFLGCNNLVSVYIPNSVTVIEAYAFFCCRGLTSIVIPNAVTTIEKSAFYGCSGLAGDLIIPNSVTSMDKDAFMECTGFDHIVVESGNTVYDSRGDCNAIIQTATNNLVLGCKNTVIPNSVTSIGERAFYDCEGLTSINIPNSVTSIGDLAFRGCSNLMSPSIPNSVTSIGTSAFLSRVGITNSKKVYCILIIVVWVINTEKKVVEALPHRQK